MKKFFIGLVASLLSLQALAQTTVYVTNTSGVRSAMTLSDTLAQSVVQVTGSPAVNDCAKFFDTHGTITTTGAPCAAGSVTGVTLTSPNSTLSIGGSPCTVVCTLTADLAPTVTTNENFTGGAGINVITANQLGALSVSASAAANTALAIQGVTSQTGPYYRTLDAGGNLLQSFGPISSSNSRAKFDLYNTQEVTPLNFERLSLYPDSSNVPNLFRLESQNGGTGGLRALALQGGGGRVIIAGTVDDGSTALQVEGTSNTTGTAVFQGNVNMGQSAGTGPILTVGNITGTSVSLQFRAAAGSTRQFQFQSGSVNRWRFLIDNSAESGSDAGSNFSISPYTDAGVVIDTPFSIPRRGTIAIGGTTLRPVRFSGTVAVGGTTATAALMLPAGTATASTAPIKFTSGTNLTTPEAGAMEFNGTNLEFSPTTSLRWNVALDLPGTTGSIGGGALLAGACTSGTATVTGATTAMTATASPVTYPGDGAYWLAYVSATNTVTVKVCGAIALTPTASTYNVRVLQ